MSSDSKRYAVFLIDRRTKISERIVVWAVSIKQAAYLAMSEKANAGKLEMKATYMKFKVDKVEILNGT